MFSMTLEQLRAMTSAGGVKDITVKGQGSGFFVEIATRSGQDAVLSKTGSTEPRRFSNPIAALNVLRDVGITVGQFDASEWNPAEKEETAGNRGRAEAMREAHKAAAYNEWLAAQIQEAIDDPRPDIPHAEVMAEMDAEIAAMTGRKRIVHAADKA
ncbi:hypothetical protein [Candidatus Thiosymbion oneisti]|uniref:antitoxin PaaA2 family protein n=1 Tax=Candidatus Thiosymbion oneisti TaxID=589554 RepID=UPI000AD81A78|nr:hypothetical protein [Candidatus Thiosymbion oneisti]